MRVDYPLCAGTLNGMSLIRNNCIPRKPRLEVDKDFQWCTTAQRDKTNAFLLEAFGSDEQILMMGNMIWASDRMIAALRERAQEFTNG